MPTPTDPGETPADGESLQGRTPRFFQRSELRAWMALLALLGSYVVVVSFLCALRAENFFTSNWDLGVNQQMLWTTGHGWLLYESGDFEFYGVHSFLQVHSAYVALLVAPIYLAAPTPSTLFVIQATAFAASAVPLFLIGRSVMRSKALLFGAVAVYLVNFAVISALFYDFHWEAFIPLEFLCFFLLVQRGWFRLSLVPLVAGILTLEVFPFLAAGVLLFFLVGRADEGRWNWRRLLADRQVRIIVGLLVIAGVAYAVIRVLQYVVIPHFVGVPGSTSGATNSLTSSLAFTATPSTLARTGMYWLLLLACLGLLPMLSPKHLILAVPWFAESTFFSPPFASQFGNQYALIAVAGLSVAFLHGLGRLETPGIESNTRDGICLTLVLAAAGVTLFASTRAGSRTLLSGALALPLALALLSGPIVVVLWWWFGRRERAAMPRFEEPLRRRYLRQSRVPLLGALIALLVVFSMIMSPVNGNNFEATPFPGYSFEWSDNPVSAQMPWVTSQVPPSAQILASDNLFPYVANDRNAYAVPWFAPTPSTPVPFFPFTPANLPRYVLVDSSQLPFVPFFLQEALFNDSVYGLVAYVYATSFPGTVYLFELGYTQSAEGRNVASPLSDYLFSAANLSIGPAGRVAPSLSAKYGYVIESDAQNLLPGAVGIWYGPYVTLPAGSYRVVFNLTGSATHSGDPLFDLSTGVFSTGGVLRNFTWSVVSSGQLEPAGWTNLEYNLTLNEPYPLVEFRGFLEVRVGTPSGTVVLNYIEVEPAT